LTQQLSVLLEYGFQKGSAVKKLVHGIGGCQIVQFTQLVELVEGNDTPGGIGFVLLDFLGQFLGAGRVEVNFYFDTGNGRLQRRNLFLFGVEGVVNIMQAIDNGQLFFFDNGNLFLMCFEFLVVGRKGACGCAQEQAKCWQQDFQSAPPGGAIRSRASQMNGTFML